MAVQPGLCWTWSEPKLLVFSRTGSYTFILLESRFPVQNSDAVPDHHIVHCSKFYGKVSKYFKNDGSKIGGCFKISSFIGYIIGVEQGVK